MDFDVAVIGGGPAGLSAALGLLRARKRVVLFDRWPPRNAAASEVRGFVTQDGVPPAEMRRTAHEELARYECFSLREDEEVTGIEKREGGFAVMTGTGRTEVRRVLVACGLVDVYPDLPGYRELWGTSLFQCPYCHGWEVRDRSFGYLAPDAGCADWSMILRAWTKDLVVFTGGRFEVPPELRAELTRGGVRIEERRVVGLRSEGGVLAAVQLEGGAEVAREILFVRPAQRQTALVTQLGIELDAPDRVHVRQYETSIPGIFAAGDIISHHHSALAAAASGAAAAHALDEGLTQELVFAGML